MAYKQNPGRGPMMKTGQGIPSPLLQEKIPTEKKVNKKIEKQSKKEDKGFFKTVSDAYSDAYKSGKGTVYGKGVKGQGLPGSGSRQGNKDLSVGIGAAVKAGYKHIFGDK
jgi:hypothetical protein